MAVRTFVTSGVAFVAAGAVAATVALAPPMSPRDIQVAKSTEVSLNALVTDPGLQELINDYFNSGTAAVVQQLLINVVGPNGTPADVINTFFNENNPLAPDEDGVSENPALFGATGVTLLGLRAATAAGLIPAPVFALINLFYQGGTPAVTQALLSALLSGAPDAQALVNDFFSGGVDQVVQTRLSAALAGAPQAQTLVNDFFNGGTPLISFRALGGDVGTPVDPDDPDSDTAPTSSPFLSAFFGINNNILNPDGSDSPGLFGASGVVLQGLHDGGVNSQQVDDFFSGGVPLVVQNQLEALAPNEQIKNLINGFFTTGISEVIRQILTEPPTPVEDATTPSTENARTMSTSTTTSVGTDPTSVDPTPTVKLAGTQLKLAGTELKTTGTEVKPADTDLKAASTELKDLTPKDSDPAPVITKVKTDPVQAQPVSAPVAPVVASPPSPPAQNSGPAAPATGKDKDPVAAKPAANNDPKDAKDPKGTDDNDVTEAMKNGNKVEVDPLLLLGPNGRGPKAGEGSWGVFGQVADAIGKAVAGAVGPASAPAKTEGAGAGAAGSAGSAGGS